MQKAFAFTVVVLSILLLSTPAEARVDLPALNESHYFVQDNAGVLSDSAINELNEKGTHLEEGTGAELLLMTMDSTGQEHRQDFALRALREYGVGKAEKDNGIVILLNLDNDNEFNNRGIEVQVGYGVEGYLNDAKIGRIIDNVAYEDLVAGNYEAALTNLYTALYDESLTAYGYEGGEFTRDEPAEDTGTGQNDSIFSILIRLAIFMTVLYFIYKMFSGGGGSGGSGGSGGRRRRSGGPVIFFPPGGGGGFGGGSSGGGFGGFGGGSGGGGGAGRGF
ncbi:TPM domain-containing protein [Jeotgalicoccus halotolerans]|uniref:TPM domain-containing protein n=1 Tax=Jeotgalicoccus halotolerans TaxID=157227 RepID=UPI003513318F